MTQPVLQPRTRAEMIETQIITDIEPFRAMRHEWNELLQASSSNCIFLTWEWMYTWWEHLSTDRELHIIAVRDAGRLIAIAPLAVRPPRLRRLIPFRTLEFLAADNVGSDYLSFVFRNGHEQDALEGIASALASRNLMLELMRIDKTSLPMASTAMHLRRHGWRSVALTTNRCPYINLAGLSLEDYWARVHSSHRSNVERKMRMARREFDVRLQLVQSEAELQLAMEALISMHLQRWDERGGSTALYSERLINFHRAFSRISLDRGWLRMYTLTLDDAPAAFLYVFAYDRVYYYYQSAFSADYSRYSTGVLITRLVIEDAISNGAIEFDFLHDDEEYKYLWARQERELVRLEFYPPNASGAIYQPVMRARQAAKRLV